MTAFIYPTVCTGVFLKEFFYFGVFHGLMNTSGLVESKGSPKYHFSFEIV